MNKIIPVMITGTLLASLLLAGCSSSSGTAANPTKQQSQTNGDQENDRPDQSMNFGKIKSISDNTLTIYTSEMPSPPEQGAGQPGEGDMQNGQGGTGDPGSAPDGEMPDGGMPEGGRPENGGQAGGPQGGGMQQAFSEEITDITIDANTKIVAVTFDNGTRQESTISLSDLKADDVIQYTLKSGTTVAESISLSSGNPGGAAPESSN